MRHFLTLEDMDLEWWSQLYNRFIEILEHPNEWSHVMDGKQMATLFYEPSSRTQFSFQSAMMKLGGKVFGFSDPMTTSIAKGENIPDTIRVISTFADVVVMRSPENDSVIEASKWSFVPVINGGNGIKEHPTQTLADLATLLERRFTIRGMHIGICGDLKYGRTVHSLIYALSKFPNVKFTLISPKGLAIPSYMVDYMKSHNIAYNETENMHNILPELDVLYMTRVQKERFSDPAEYERYRGTYILNRESLKNAKTNLLIMHPLPRVDEISPEIDNDPRAAYFDQVKYGMYMRMALLTTLI